MSWEFIALNKSILAYSEADFGADLTQLIREGMPVEFQYASEMCVVNGVARGVTIQMAFWEYVNGLPWLTKLKEEKTQDA